MAYGSPTTSIPTIAVCPACGCRLGRVDDFDVRRVAHYRNPKKGYDARGCLCPQINDTWFWDRDTLALVNVTFMADMLDAL